MAAVHVDTVTCSTVAAVGRLGLVVILATACLLAVLAWLWIAWRDLPSTGDGWPLERRGDHMERRR